MALTVTDFKLEFPEFASAPDTLVQATLNRAITRCPAAVWGVLQEEGAFVYTAHFLALSPFARKMALSDPKGATTIYAERLRTLKLTVTSGFRTTT